MPEEKTFELLRKKSIENNEILVSLIEKSSILLEVIETPVEQTDWKELLRENPLEYEDKVITFLKSGVLEEGYLKNGLNRQIYELVKENAGFKIAINNLLAILQKYKNIIEELMRMKTSME